MFISFNIMYHNGMNSTITVKERAELHLYAEKACSRVNFILPYFL